jgi:hypothetical protein
VNSGSGPVRGTSDLDRNVLVPRSPTGLASRWEAWLTQTSIRDSPGSFVAGCRSRLSSPLRGSRYLRGPRRIERCRGRWRAGIHAPSCPSRDRRAICYKSPPDPPAGCHLGKKVTHRTLN